jgi:DNA-binding transcriptional regulator YiaG
LENIKQLRALTGWSQQHFADYFGIPRRTLQAWEYSINRTPPYILPLLRLKLEHDGVIKPTAPE